MNVSRSGYYKWLKTRNDLNNYELNRKDLGELIIKIHNKKQRYDWTYYVDVFNDEIIGSNVKSFLHCSNPIIIN